MERPSAHTSAPALPWPLRVIAAMGRGLLRIRRLARRAWRSLVHGLERLGRSPLIAAPFAALSVVLVGLTTIGLIVAGAWWGGVEPPGPWQEALSVTGSAWVMAYGVPVRLLAVDYSLIPWGLMVIPLWLSHQAGRWLMGVVRPRRWRTLVVTWALAVLVGAGLVAVVSVLADIPDVQTSARRGLVMGLVVGALGVGSGIWRSNDLPRQAIGRIPVVLRVVLRASFVGFAALVGLAAVVLAVAAASSFGEIVTVTMALEPTMFDAVVLLLLSLGYLPTLMGWALGYLVGAGVSLGPDVLVSPFVAAVPPTPLPTFPPLAALPDASGPASWALPALIVLAGALVGLSISRWAAKEGPLIRIAIALVSAVVAAGWVFAFLWISSGSLGDGRLASIGPDAGLGALLAGVGLVIGALPTSILRAQRRQRRLKVVEPVVAGDGTPSPITTAETPA